MKYVMTDISSRKVKKDFIVIFYLLHLNTILINYIFMLTTLKNDN
jgi:hypothetical protein